MYKVAEDQQEDRKLISQKIKQTGAINCRANAESESRSDDADVIKIIIITCQIISGPS